jgi:hypothetical protein
MKTIYLDPKTLSEETRRLFRQGFPSYPGKTFKIRGVSGPVDLRSYWDGGSRDYFAVVRSDGQALDIPVQSAYDKALAGAECFVIPDGVVVVEHTIYCGKDHGLTLVVPEERLAAFLPAPALSLTDEQEIVLHLTVTLIPAARRERSGMSNERWDVVKAELVELGLLQKNGAITPEGRNHVAR